MNQVEEGPSRWYYGLVAAVLVAGCAYFVFFRWENISRTGVNLTQVVVSGEAQLSLSKPGRYTIFYEYQSVVGNKIYSTGEDLPGLECSLVSTGTRSEIPLSPSTVSFSYSVGCRSAVSVLEFQIESPGADELSAQYREGRDGPEVVLAVGRGFTGDILKAVFGALGILFGSIGAAVAIVVITLIKRDKARKRAADRYA